jgi:hypothetical protein
MYTLAAVGMSVIPQNRDRRRPLSSWLVNVPQIATDTST